MKTFKSALLFSSIALGLSMFFTTYGHAGLLESGFEASYEVSHNSFYLGDSVRNLKKQDNQTWIYRSDTSPKGIAKAFVSDVIEEISMINRNVGQFYPVEYKYRQHGGKKQTEFTLNFDWTANKLTNTYNKQTYELKPDTHDLLSFQIQLMHDLQAGKSKVSYVIADKKRVDTYNLKSDKKDSVETPMKTFNAIKLVSNKIRDKMQFIIWCAPELGYLPVKVMKIEEDGDKSIMVLKSIKLN